MYYIANASHEDYTRDFHQQKSPGGVTGGLSAVTLPFSHLKLGRKVSGDSPHFCMVYNLLLKRKRIFSIIKYENLFEDVYAFRACHASEHVRCRTGFRLQREENTMKTITVHASQTYPIWIGRGLLGQCGTYLKQQTKAQTAAVITDDHVDCYYGDIVTKSLEENGFRTIKFVFPHGEASKCSKTLNQIYDFLCENNITRTDCLVALGGGVVGDITGFAAATYLRGLDYLQIPTSLLAQVDSSVGGKTAIDLTGGKNLVGAFKQPVAVLCDLDTLHTLPKLFLADGMGEVIKYGMIRDEKLFTLLEQHTLETVSEVMDEIVPTCIDIKRDVVEHDEFDTGERMILNFGHTLGHAVESYYHYETYTHGSAVAAGMCMMTRATCTPELYVRLCDCVKAYDLPTEVDAPVAELVPLCGNDKKRASASLRFIVCETIGKAEIRSMPFTEFAAWMGGVDA